MFRWKLLDFAELKRSSISFFDIEKPETAISRWSRARTRAAKVSVCYIMRCTKHTQELLGLCFGPKNTVLLRIFQVGKGLSKDEKARKLALQHWLEAVSL